MECVICEQEITADPFGAVGGCNAQPVADGQCCYRCDIDVVLSARLVQYGYGIRDVKQIVADIWQSVQEEVRKGAV